MILYAVVAAEYHRAGQADHLLGGLIYCTGSVAMRIQIENSLNQQIIRRGYFLVHPTSVVVEFVNY